MVSIIIPTKNGEQYLEEVLEMVFKQKTGFDFEVIIIDSGSQDKTLQIIEKFRNFTCHPELVSGSNKMLKQACPEEMLKQVQHDTFGVQHDTFGVQYDIIQCVRQCVPQLKLYQIPAQKFNHGLTRNFAASKTEGEYLIFLTQDATPANEHWLQDIVRPFQEDEKIAGVFGKHLPRKNCDPFQKRTLKNFFESFGLKTTIYQIEEPADREKLFEKNKHVLTYFSNVNSAIRKDVWGKIPFRKVEMGEDQFWAKEIILAGYKKAYEPSAAVYHSHRYGAWPQFKRWFDEFRQHKIIQNYKGVSGIWKIIPLTLRLAFNDVKYIIHQSEYNFGQKIYWSVWIFFMDLMRILSEYLGGRYEKLPQWLQNKLSMQYQIIHRK